MVIKSLRLKRAQGTLEYAILISLVVAAFLAMNMYMKGGLQGRIKASTDDIGQQYSPETSKGHTITTVTQKSTETVLNQATKTDTVAEQNRIMHEDTGPESTK